MEYRVHKAAASQAEIKLDIESAGHWFGGGHLMRQLWPLNRASLETGPFFPFDNGPNGVNTLVAPQWLTRYVLSSTVAERGSKSQLHEPATKSILEFPIFPQ